MKYTNSSVEYSQYLSQETCCPFCHLPDVQILQEYPFFFVIAARAPYAIDHVLIIPKRHVIFLHELTSEESLNLHTLVLDRNNRLLQYHEGTTILLRDSVKNTSTDKTVDHLHVHIVPDCCIESKNADHRIFYDEQTLGTLVTNMKHRFCTP